MDIYGDEKKRAALLIRRSLEDRNEKESIEFQKEMCIQKAENEDLKIVEIIVEEKSAYNLRIDQRPGLQKILDMMTDNEIDYVVCWQKSRLIRDLDDEIIFTTVLRKTGCQVVFADPSELPIDTQEENDVNRLLHLIKTWSDQTEVAKLRTRVKQHLRTRASLGNYIGGTYTGYVWNTHTKKLEQIPGEIDVVKKIFHMYLYNGYSVKQIANQLNEEGFRTKKQKKFWPSTVVSILQSKIYCGYYRWGFTTSKRRAAPVRADGYDQKVDWVEPIVTLDEWNRVQNLMISRSAKKRGSSNRKIPKSSFLLSGIVFCGVCGNKMHGRNGTSVYKRKDGTEKQSEYFRYFCNSTDPHPVPKRIDAKMLDQNIFLALVREIKTLDREALFDIAKSELLNVSSGLLSEKKGYETKIKKHMLAVENLLVNVESTTDSDLLSLYGDRIKTKKNEIEAIREDIRSIESRIKKVELTQNDLDEFLNFIGTIESYEEFNQEKRKLYIDNLVEAVVVTGEDVKVTLKWDLFDESSNEFVTSVNRDFKFIINK